MAQLSRSDPNGPKVRPDRHIPIGAILTVLGLIILTLALWQLSYVVLLAFAAVLIAIGLRHSAGYLTRYLSIPIKLGVFVVLAVMIGLFATLITMAGPRIADEFNQLLSSLPKAWEQLRGYLEGSTIGGTLQDMLSISGSGEGAAAPSGIFGFIQGTLSAVVGSLANIVLIITIAMFLATEPRPYINGALRLVPINKRDRAAEIVSELGTSLWKWLLGQSIDMAAVAVLTGLGLWVLGVPLALVLGLIAGITNIIPYIGPFISAVPAILFALTQGPMDAVYVAILFVLVQQFEGNFLLPLIQKRAVDMPPVLTILGVVGFGSIFGLPGILVATPLTLVLIILVRRLYIEDVLGDDLD